MATVFQNFSGYMDVLGRTYHDENTETHGRMETRLILAMLQFKVMSAVALST